MTTPELLPFDYRVVAAVGERMCREVPAQSPVGCGRSSLRVPHLGFALARSLP